MHRRSMLLGACAVAFVGCSGKPAPSPYPPTNARSPAEQPAQPDDPGAVRVLRHLGKERVAVLAAAETATSFRIDGHRAGSGEGERFRSCPILKTGPALTREQLETLRRLLLDGQSYVWDMAKGCDPVWGVGIRFEAPAPTDGGGPRTLDVRLCFECDMWDVWLGSERVGQNFDPVRAQLAALSKAWFPDDPAIQALK